MSAEDADEDETHFQRVWDEIASSNENIDNETPIPLSTDTLVHFILEARTLSASNTLPSSVQIPLDAWLKCMASPQLNESRIDGAASDGSLRTLKLAKNAFDALGVACSYQPELKPFYARAAVHWVLGAGGMVRSESTDVNVGSRYLLDEEENVSPTQKSLESVESDVLKYTEGVKGAERKLVASTVDTSGMTADELFVHRVNTVGVLEAIRLLELEQQQQDAEFALLRQRSRHGSNQSSIAGGKANSLKAKSPTVPATDAHKEDPQKWMMDYVFSGANKIARVSEEESTGVEAKESFGRIEAMKREIAEPSESNIPATIFRIYPEIGAAHESAMSSGSLQARKSSRSLNVLAQSNDIFVSSETGFVTPANELILDEILSSPETPMDLDLEELVPETKPIFAAVKHSPPTHTPAQRDLQQSADALNVKLSSIVLRQSNGVLVASPFSASDDSLAIDPGAVPSRTNEPKDEKRAGILWPAFKASLFVGLVAAAGYFVFGMNGKRARRTPRR
ncbi:hypothetical protein BJ741DRAFT_671718 [Chytriomyces cf. hyalinus JEL632]|nr:hypothetical protein BJ741DRAFT_671718 [Chytriomyces cf. hyalinus JEL632]